MLKKSISILGALFMTAQCSAQTPGIHERPYFKTGIWDGRVQLDQSNQFVSCSAYGHFDMGTALHFVLTKDLQWILGADNTQWLFIIGENLGEISLSIDNNAPFHISAGASSLNGIALILPPTEEVFQQFSKGNSLKITINKKTVRFSLKDTGKALDALTLCVQQHKLATHNPGSSQPRFEESDTTIAIPKSSDINHDSKAEGNNKPSYKVEEKKDVSLDEKVEAIRFVANMLSRGNFQGYTLLSQQEMASPETIEWVSKATVAWKAPEDIIGGLHIYEGKTEDLDSLLAKTLAEDAVECTGSFISSKYSEENPLIRRATAGCKEGDGLNGKIEYIFFARPEGLIYRFGIFQTIGKQGTPRTKADEEEAQKMRNTLNQLSD